MSEKEKLDLEVQSAGLQYRDPPTPKDGNCMFHAFSDQLARLGFPQHPIGAAFERRPISAKQPSSVGWNSPEGVYFLPSLGGLLAQNVSRDWITLWGLVNMLNIDMAVVSSIGEGGLRVTSPDDTSNSDHNLNRTALLGHQAEEHYHSLTTLPLFRLGKGRILSPT